MGVLQGQDNKQILEKPGLTTYTGPVGNIIFPGGAVAEDAKVVVVRVEDYLQVTNEGDTQIEGVEVWLNREWGCWVSQLPVASTVQIKLSEFENQHGERFPLATWLAPDKTIEVVSVDLYKRPDNGNAEPGQRYRVELRKAEPMKILGG